MWLLIQFLMYETRPQTILEFGSGRSTHYFTEYCNKVGGSLCSIEQNKRYVRKNFKGMRASFLQPQGLWHVPIKGDWFDVEALEGILGAGSFDLLLVDAPGGGGKGTRNSVTGNAFLRRVSHRARIIIVDDFHRSEVRESVSEFMSERTALYLPRLFTYDIGGAENQLLFILDKGVADRFDAFVSLVQLETFAIDMPLTWWSELSTRAG